MVLFEQKFLLLIKVVNLKWKMEKRNRRIGEMKCFICYISRYHTFKDVSIVECIFMECMYCGCL
uniref:Putative ovule protein n=1 Tax=Solanum chacoense TaxID=4108 RepID=A0A0V0GMT5_SOLCH